MRLTILQTEFGKIAISPVNPSLIITDKIDHVFIAVSNNVYKVNARFNDIAQQINDDMKA